jgi:hypothetical protein
MLSPAGENPSQSYRDNTSPIYDETNFSQRSSRYSQQQISPVSPQHHHQQREIFHEVPNWPLPSFDSFPDPLATGTNSNADNERGGSSSSEDSLGDPKGFRKDFTEKDLMDVNHLAPPLRQRDDSASAYALRGDSWARRSDPFDLDRDSRCLD